MRKKFTSALLVVMALMLSLPTLAQVTAQKQTGQLPTFKVMELQSGKLTAPQVRATFQQQAKKSKKALADARKQELSIKRSPKGQISLLPQTTFRAAGEEVVDEHGIITSPAEGMRKVYSRSGKMLVNDEGIQTYDQSGTMQIVWCDDNTVYIRNILASFPTGAWVKGTYADDVITVPTRQPVYFNSSAGVTFSIGWVLYEPEMFSYSCYDGYASAFTFTVSADQKTLTLQNSTEQIFMGLLWDDDDTFGWHGDWESVWNYEKDFEPMAVTTVAAPDGMTTEQWFVRAHTIVAEESQVVKGNVNMGIVDNKVYIQGLFADYPEGWMMGTIADGIVTFDGLQTQAENVYGVGGQDGNLVPFTMTYDADNKVLTSQCQLLANTSITDISTVFAYTDITVQAADPWAPITEYPYTNTLDDMEAWEWFTTIDANQDEYTWHWYSEGQASYKYHAENAADDWLITPAFRLEAGKTYVFSVDANGSSEMYAETFEVKMGTAATVEAMTTEVIASSTVESERAQTFANKAVTVSETGTYYFGIHCTSPADQASLRMDNVSVDERILTAPAAVTDLVVTPSQEKAAATITFTAPSKTIGDADLTSITKAEILRDGAVIATLTDVTPGAAQNYVDEDETLTTGTYTYQVLCYNADGKGDISEPVEVSLAAVFSIPYYGDFTDVEADVFSQFTVIDANNDGYFFENDANKATYTYNSDKAADDYLISPALHLEAGTNYAITVDVGSGGYPETFEMLVGQQPTPEGLTIKVLEDGVVELEDFKVYEVVFRPETSGTYYVAVHCTSPADQYLFSVNRLNVELGPADDAPAAATLTVTPAAEGAKSATLDITLPSKTVADGGLIAISEVEIFRDGSSIGTMEEGLTPGATVQYVDSDEEMANGTHIYMVVCSNDAGSGKKSEQASVFIGMDAPTGITEITATDQTTTVKLDWEAVSTLGANGGYVDPAAVTYKVWTCDPNSSYVMSYEPTMITEPGVTTATLDYNTNEGEQGFQSWVVTAMNDYGDSWMGDSYLATLVVGKPYDLPIQEGFADGSLHYYWESNALALQYSQATDGDGAAFALSSGTENTEIYLMSGKLNINDAENPTLIFDAAGFGVTSVQVMGRPNGTGDGVDLGTYTVSDADYSTVKVPLKSLQSAEGGYVQFAIMCTITNPTVQDMDTGEMTFGDALILDNIRVIDQYSDNLSICLTGPETLGAGKTAGVMAIVTNWGENAAKDYKVTVKAGEKVIAEETVSEELAVSASDSLVVMLETSLFDEAGDLTVSATVEYAADKYPADNQAETVITITEPAVPAPASISAEDMGSEGAVVAWQAPAEKAVTTESFEDGMGGWTAIDSDADGYNWTYSKNGETEYHMGTNSGLGCVFSESYTNSVSKALTPDNWLVSPLSDLGGTFSFYAKGQDADWCQEHFAVYVSTTSATDVNAFTQVMDEQVATDEYTEYTVDLSTYEGQQGYIAIRHYNVSDQFVLDIDDITYAPVCSGYNVYYEQQLVATVEKDVTTYTVAADKMEGGERQFAVTAVYANGQESKPVVTTATIITSIREIAADGQSVDVYSLDGKLLRKQAKTLDGLKGIYVINGRNVLVK